MIIVQDIYKRQSLEYKQKRERERVRERERERERKGEKERDDRVQKINERVQNVCKYARSQLVRSIG
jgi:hypothetical protein